MTIQEFLEEEKKKFHDEYSAFNLSNRVSVPEYNAHTSWLKEHDTHLINFILDKVATGEKEKWVKIFDYHNDVSNDRHTAMRNTARVEIEYWDKYPSTIINQLRIK